MSTVTVYTKPACVQCNAVFFKMLDKEGISYEKKIDLTVDDEARDYVMSLATCRRPWCTPGPTSTSRVSAPPTGSRPSKA